MLPSPVKAFVHKLVNERCVHTQMLFHGKNRETKKIMRMEGKKRFQRRGKGKRSEEREAKSRV